MRIDIDATVEKVWPDGRNRYDEPDFYVVISIAGREVARIKQEYISRLDFDHVAAEVTAEWFRTRAGSSVG